LLTTESASSVNKEDILDFTVNLNPNGTYGEYSLQLTAEAFSFDVSEIISIKSASGLDPLASLVNPANNLASVFSISAPGPRNLALDNDQINENNSLNALVGRLSSIDANPAAALTYSLVSGFGDTDNNKFSTSGSSLLAFQVFDHEKKSSYNIRVRVSNQFSQYIEKNFTISVKDVNELPTLDAIADFRFFSIAGQQTLALNNMTAGPEVTQKVIATVKTDNGTLFDNIAIVGNQLRYNIKAGATGNAKITITVTDDGDTLSGGPMSIERSFNLTIDPVPTVSADLSTISKGFSSNLSLISSSPLTYSWSPSLGLSRTDIANPVARPSQTTTYTVTVTNQFGFSINLFVTIVVNEDFNFMIPNVFSPNGDGQNDLWVIENIESYPDHELTIFDRSGRVLKKVKNYQNDWNGLANGLPLEEGTYYYTIRFIDKNVLKKGFITLVR
jgi:gliding motility-associated-like protein